ncbi:uncharacterized protein METZ01_LOCUS190598, partial [marine metagenome]
MIETVALIATVASGTLLFGAKGTIVAGILATIIVLFRSLGLTRQFSDLTEDVVRMTSIDRTHRLNPAGPAELARLARAVNRLVDRVGADISKEESERLRLSSIFNSMRDGVVVVDDQGVIELTNPAAVEMLAAAIPVEPGMQLTSLTNHPDVVGVVALAISSGNTESAEVELFDNQRTLMALATPFPRPDTNLVRALLLLTDLTGVRRLDTTRREFVSNASHELRTPLSGIRASAETLQLSGVDDLAGRKKFVEMILEDVDRMDKLITEMLELSRLESGESPLDLQDVDPSVLTNAAVSQFSTIIEQSELTIESSTHPELPLVRVDVEKMSHVFANLISNAIKWTPSGGTITIKTWLDERSICFSVADTGQGIEPEHLPHIFE